MKLYPAHVNHQLNHCQSHLHHLVHPNISVWKLLFFGMVCQLFFSVLDRLAVHPCIEHSPPVNGREEDVEAKKLLICNDAVAKKVHDMLLLLLPHTHGQCSDCSPIVSELHVREMETATASMQNKRSTSCLLQGVFGCSSICLQPSSSLLGRLCLLGKSGCSLGYALMRALSICQAAAANADRTDRPVLEV